MKWKLKGNTVNLMWEKLLLPEGRQTLERPITVSPEEVGAKKTSDFKAKYDEKEAGRIKEREKRIYVWSLIMGESSRLTRSDGKEMGFHEPFAGPVLYP